MADDGRSIADAYRNWSGDSAAAAPSAGASIADAYRAQAADTAPPASSTWGVPQDPAAQRIRAAAIEAFRNAPSLGEEPGNMSVLSTGSQNWIDRNIPVVGPYIINPAARLAGTVVGAGAAAGAAGAATIGELATAAGAPGLGRDLNLAAQVAPAAFVSTGGVNPLSYVPKVEAPGPKFALGVGPVDPAVVARADARGAVRNALEGPGEPPASPTGIEGRRPLPPGYVPPSPVSSVAPAGAVPMTSDAAKDVARAYYQTFDRAAQDGGSLTPQATNKFIASVEAAAPKPGIGQAVAGQNAITDLVERLQPYKDKPMSLQDVNDIDKQLGNLVSAEYGKTGVSDIGRQLQGIQHDFRDQAANPSAGDVVSGQAGIDALGPARKAYSQAMKLDTIERIQERADMTDNPTTSVRTQVRTLLNNDRLSRAFSDEEKAALRDAADRGATATALHIMGSRLFPLIAGGVGSAGGFFGAVAGGTAGHFLNEGARWAENALAARRMQNALSVVSKSVPPGPLQP